MNNLGLNCLHGNNRLIINSNISCKRKYGLYKYYKQNKIMPLLRLPALDFLVYANITFARNWNRVVVRGADPPLKKIIYLVKLPKHKPILPPTQIQLLHCNPPPPYSFMNK